MTAQYVFTMQKLSKIWPGGKEVFKDISLSFLPGAKIGVLGLNGSGKSTLLKIIAGLDQEFIGEAWPADGISIGFLPQEPTLDESKDVQENVLEGLEEEKELLEKFNEISSRFTSDIDENEMNDLIIKQTEIQEKIDQLDAWDIDRKVEIAMEALRLPKSNQSVKNLSGGEKRRVALCKLLLSSPDILLLDEPTNHMDAETVSWLQRFLHDYKNTVITVTHDRYFLDEVAGWILEIDRGRGIPYEGNYSGWLDQKKKRLEVENKSELSRQKTLDDEIEWVRSSPKARQAKSKARLNAYDELFKKENLQKEEIRRISIPSGPRLGDLVIECNNLNKSYEDKNLFENLSFKIPPAAIVGIIGPNGAGKTTLFRLITEIEKPNSGEIIIGETVKLGYVDQSRENLNENQTVWEAISEGYEEIELGSRTISSRAYSGLYGFKGSDQQKRLNQLSGGERNRVNLARVLKSGANLLLLDEPTNDLDVETLRSLEQAIIEFAGCAIIISHDRWFLDRIVTHILAFEGNSHVEWFEGNFQAYEEDKIKRLGIEASKPSRIKYKPISR
tara:strand:+ start:69 stop:1745 length:1677 start_codon:yes stop_codon:yes gene_type:complete